MSRHTSMSTNQTTRDRYAEQRARRIDREQRAAFQRNLRALDGLRVQGLGR